MGFSERDKLVALAIVHIFETSKPFGDYSTVAVLNDGAGISYGINQFTHRSGSLFAVLDRFVDLGGKLTPAVQQVMQSLGNRSMIQSVAANATVKTDLRRLAADPRMQQAQREISFEKYLQPAIEACEGSDFTLPLSLAVIFDSINHGSFEKIRDRVVVERPGNGSMKEIEFEKEWISRYVRKRDAWLESIPRLAVTDYRTDFFLAQIARGNWNLNLPLNVHGFRLTELIFEGVNPFTGLADDEINLDIPAAEPRQNPAQQPQSNLPVNEKGEHAAAAMPAAEAQPIQQAEAIVNVGDQSPVPANFVPETVAVDAPQPTGFLGKIKAQLVGLGIGAGTLATIKEWTGVQLSAETVELLKIVVPTVLGLGFIGFVVWFVSEKIVGFKTLKMQTEINTDPNRHNVQITPQ